MSGSAYLIGVWRTAPGAMSNLGRPWLAFCSLAYLSVTAPPIARIPDRDFPKRENYENNNSSTQPKDGGRDRCRVLNRDRRRRRGGRRDCLLHLSRRRIEIGIGAR